LALNAVVKPAPFPPWVEIQRPSDAGRIFTDLVFGSAAGEVHGFAVRSAASPIRCPARSANRQKIPH
jgi:hypothetical protein